MYRQNSHTFPPKKTSIIRTMDTKSQPLGVNSYKLNFFFTDTLAMGQGVNDLWYMYHFLSAVTQTLTLYQSAINQYQNMSQVKYFVLLQNSYVQHVTEKYN